MKAKEFYPINIVRCCFDLLGIALLTMVLFAGSACAAETVDKVVVEKDKRKMYLVDRGKVVKSYRISLGDNPKGHKERQGDERTPEGRYVIDYRNPYSGYHLSLHISYPNAEDKKRAKALGVDPGGMIMIHGAPNGWHGGDRLLKQTDWTNGCIAVSNVEIEEIWELVEDGTVIEIKP